VWERSGTRRGRDASRVPVPWDSDDPDSTLSFFRHAIELRRSRSEFSGTPVEWLDAPADALVFVVDGGVVCALNAGRRPVAVPEGEVLLASDALEEGKLPPNAVAWLV
jgi:alpha-glucosidase